MVKNLFISFIVLLLMSCGNSSSSKSDSNQIESVESVNAEEKQNKTEGYQFLVNVGEMSPLLPPPGCYSLLT
jgi:hypothetical protein